MLNLGGDLRAWGDAAWQIGVADPRDPADNASSLARFTLRAPHALARFIAPKGSVALDGVSLTVNQVEEDTFTVLIIPHTLAVTSFGALREGSEVNLEIDTMARYAARLMEAR